MWAAPVRIVLHRVEVCVIEVLETEAAKLLATCDFKGLLEIVSPLLVTDQFL